MKTPTLTAAMLATTMLATPALAQDESKTMATVVKIDGIAWFNRMREGVDENPPKPGTTPIWSARPPLIRNSRPR